MKRSRITRRTPLKPGTSRLKRTPMKRISASKRKEKAATDGPRRALLESAGGRCMKCDRHRDLEVHEIARGPARCKAVYLPRLQLVVCRECHEALGSLGDYPAQAQLAIRLVWEIEESRRELNAARGRAPDAVSSDELFWEIDFLANP